MPAVLMYRATELVTWPPSLILVDSNTSFSVQANGAGNVLGVVNSIFNGSPTGISLFALSEQARQYGPSTYGP